MAFSPATTREELVRHDPEYVPALERELRDAVAGEVRFDAGSRGLYSTDASNYRQIPFGVVLPKSNDDVLATVEICRKYGAPITSRGGGTSLAGQCCNVAVIIDWTKYLYHVLEVDPHRRVARVEPGCVLDRLRRETEQFDLTFGPDPATHTHCTLGGMIGNNSCGIHSVMSQFYGPGPVTADNVESLEILTYDGERMTVAATSEHELQQIMRENGRRGEIYRRLRELADRFADPIRKRFPQIPRLVSGYSLHALLPENGFNLARALVGTEGTCVIVLGATVKLIERPPARALVVIGYPDVYQAGDHVPQVLAHKPVGLEGIDDQLVSFLRKKGLRRENLELLPEGNGWLLAEFGAHSHDEAVARADELMSEIRREGNPPAMKLIEDDDEQERIWEIRESGLAATAHVPGMSEAYPGWEDAAVDPEKVGHYLRDFRQLLGEFDYDCALYGHFGQGCIHCRITFDLKSREGLAKYLRFIDRAADLVLKYGGSFSGEHGDGQSRAALLPKMYGAELVDAFRQFKTIWDPQGKMNPGKLVDPYPPEANLKWSPQNYHPRTLDTHFRYPQDSGSLVQAANRCVGVGKCRREEHGTMCPSYMVTREEKHSTRGRARLLYEMLQGDVISDGWRDEHVHDALDLCLACKGCKGECPVNVDIATYKAEFLSHYYEGRWRPLEAYTMGRIYWWARLASKAPRLANLFSQTWPFSASLKWFANIAPERKLPRFASPTFAQWFNDREAGASRQDTGEQSHLPVGFGPRRVILWPDTFSNYLHPAPAQAAVRVLEHAGYYVTVPPRPLCCGRPLYDWGWMDSAKRLWLQTLEVLQRDIDAGVPVIGLEPSCVAAFRDELINLFPGEGAARRLSQQTYLFSEFLEREKFEPPQLGRRALVHGHCHHKSILGFDSDELLLKRLGLDYTLVDSGCCGMAGAFGYTKHHYEVSIQCGERVLLPAVREADDDTLLIADGFSCREQIEQCTNRSAVHLAEVVWMAIEQSGQLSREDRARSADAQESAAMAAARSR